LNHDKPIFSQPQTGAEMYAPDKTYRQSSRDFIQQYLTPLFGTPLARQYSEAIVGADPNNPMPRNPLGLGFADATPVGLLFGGQESGRDFFRAMDKGDKIGMAGAGFGLGLSAAEAFPLTKIMVRGGTNKVNSFLRNVNRKSVADESNLTIPEKPEVLMTSPGPKTVRDDETNVKPPKGVSRRGVLQGIVAAPIATGVLGELPVSKIASKIAKVKVPDIVPKSILTKASAIINKRKLLTELGLNSRDFERGIPASNKLQDFFDDKLEPESLQELGLGHTRGLRNSAADAKNSEFLFKNDADKNKYLELDKKRADLKKKNDDFINNGPGTFDQRLLSKTLKEGEKLEQKAEVEMFKFIRDAYKGNKLKEDFFRTSGYIPKKYSVSVDPMESAQYYYKNLKSAKNYFGKDYNNLRKLSTEDLEKFTNNNLTGTVDLERKALQKELMALPREVPTPKSLSDKFKANDAKREAYEDLKMLNKFDGEDEVRATKAKPFIEYQKENDFTDDEMIDLLERSIEKAIDFEDAMGKGFSGKTELTDNLLDDGNTKSFRRD
jgi:hypothetical protein